VQARGQFAQVEGLEQVIVGTGLQAGDPVADGIARGKHQHRQLQALLAQASQQGEAVFVGQAEVEYQHIEMRRAQQGFGIRRGRGMVDDQALGIEPGDDAAGDQRVVFGKQHVHG